jgi:hypothetical protein
MIYVDFYLVFYRRLCILYRRVFTLLNVQERWTRADAAIIATFASAMAGLIYLMAQI